MSEERMSERGNSQPCYHLTGCVEVAPEAVLRKRFELMQPVLEAVGNATIKSRLPLPRYMSPAHAAKAHRQNWAEADFQEILRNGSTAPATRF